MSLGLAIFRGMSNRDSPKKVVDDIAKDIKGQWQYNSARDNAQISLGELNPQDPSSVLQHQKMARLVGGGASGNYEDDMRTAKEFDSLGNEKQSADLNRAIASGDTKAVEKITGVKIFEDPSGKGFRIGSEKGFLAKTPIEAMQYLGPGIDFSKIRVNEGLFEDRAETNKQIAFDKMRYGAQLRRGQGATSGMTMNDMLKAAHNIVKNSDGEINLKDAMAEVRSAIGETTSYPPSAQIGDKAGGNNTATTESNLNDGLFSGLQDSSGEFLNPLSNAETVGDNVLGAISMPGYLLSEGARRTGNAISGLWNSNTSTSGIPASSLNPEQLNSISKIPGLSGEQRSNILINSAKNKSK